MDDAQHTQPEDVYPLRVLNLDSLIACRIWYYLVHERDKPQCPIQELWAVCACSREGLRQAVTHLEAANIVTSEFGHDADARERVIKLTAKEQQIVNTN